jgi:hypothetical protein
MGEDYGVVNPRITKQASGLSVAQNVTTLYIT